MPKAKTSAAKGTPKGFMDKLKDFSMDKLQELLTEMLGKEDYEKAAKIRDEMNKRN